LWGFGLWFWGMGFGVLAQFPKPQSPIPNPQYLNDFFYIKNFLNSKFL
jgi:hypothetical protein